MKKILAMGLVLALCLCGCGEKTGTDDLEKFTWGMTRDEVIEEKGSQPDETKEDGKELVYKGEERYGLPCDVSYWVFPEDGLESIFCYYSENHDDISGYQEDFQAVSQQMKEKFGEPTWTDGMSEEELASFNPDEFEEKEILSESWEQGETYISHSLDKWGDSGVLHVIYYGK